MTPIIFRIGIIVGSILIAFAIIQIFKLIERNRLIRIPVSIGNLAFDPEIRESVLPVDLNPGYFAFFGKLYAYHYSPYADNFQNFDLSMSLDKNTWVKLPLHSSLPDKKDTTKFAELGFAELNKPRIPIFIKSLLPPQQVKLPRGVTKEDFLNSVQGYIAIKVESTTHDRILAVITIIALSSLIFAISNSFLTKFES